MPRKRPNILITGTPGVGKTTTASQLASSSTSTAIPLRTLSVNDIAKQHNLYSSYDDRLQTQVIDEDALLDEVEKQIGDGNDEGGWIIDYHVSDIFPERWVDLVVVLRCSDTRVFYERMEKRGYGEEKSQENIDAEIFGVIAEEAREGYSSLGEGGVVELESVDIDQVDENCERILEWVKNWVEDRGRQGAEEDG